MANYSIGLVWAFRKCLDSACCKGKDTDSFQGKDTDLFSSSNAFKNNDALWTLQIQSDPYRRSLGFILSEKEILPTWMNSSKFLRWFRISVLYLIRNKLKGQTSRHYLGWNNSNGWTRNSLEDETNWNDFMSRATLQLWFWGLPL